MVLLHIFGASAFADLSADETVINVGDKITVTYVVPNRVENIGGITLGISYNPAHFTADDFTTASLRYYDGEAGVYDAKGAVANISSGEARGSWVEYSCTMDIPAGQALMNVVLTAVAETEASQISVDTFILKGKIDPSIDGDGNDNLTLLSGVNDSSLYIKINPAHMHKLTHVSGKAATCVAEGNIEYWVCSDCGKYFSDESAKTEIDKNSVVIGKIAHISGGDWMSDDLQHWHMCKYGCGTRIDIEKHKFTAWNDIEQVNDQERVKQSRYCSVCGYVQIRNRPFLGIGIPFTGDENVLTVFIIACVLSITVAGTVFFNLRKKRRKAKH